MCKYRFFHQIFFYFKIVVLEYSMSYFSAYCKRNGGNIVNLLENWKSHDEY